jgi:metal-responsive CopG/Arc/MetJ family transcriptional regulator
MPAVDGYTFGMKTAISLPDRIFREAERQARRMGKSRSEFYAQAVGEYLARHSPDAVTDAMNQVCERVNQKEEGRFARAAARRILKRESW